MAGSYDTLAILGTGSAWPMAAALPGAAALVAAGLGVRHRLRRLQQDRRIDAALVENLAEGVYRATPEGRHVFANKALVRLNGFSSREEMLAAIEKDADRWYVEPGRRQQFREILFRDDRIEDFVSEIFRLKTRERIWIAESARLVRDEKSGEPIYYEGTVREITATVQRLSAEAQLQKLTSQLPAGLFQFTAHADGSSTVRHVSDGCQRITGIPSQEIYTHPAIFGDLVVHEDREAFFRSLFDATSQFRAWDHEFRLRARDGTVKWIHLLAHPEQEPDGITWYGCISDVSVRKQQELEIEELAFFDPLTGLPNRRLLLRRISGAVETCAGRGGHAALLFIDLDNFKTLNDTQGHDVGDLYLIEVASRLRSCVGEADTVARIGGDEFVVILERPGGSPAEVSRAAIVAAGRILASLRNEFRLGKLHHVGSASLGIVVFDGSERRVEQLLKHADIAMYQAKAAGRNGMALFDPAAMEREAEGYKLLNELRAALSEGRLELHYQPQFDHERRLTGAEALVRWNHPTRGMIYPGTIMPLVEQFGLGAELSAFVIEQGLRTLAAWQSDRQTSHLRLALNMSVQSVGAEGFVVGLARGILAHGIDPRALTFELVEHVNARDRQRAAAQMRKLKELGIRLALDDFGTGYSSLTFLKDLPFDEVKIDGSFVRDIEKSDSDRALVKTMLSMASNLGLTVVAEHVENIRQEAYLRAFGCDSFQGFLYCKPLPLPDFMGFVRAGAARHIEPHLASA